MRHAFRTRTVALAGIAGPLLWLAAWIYCGSIRPGYDPINQAISELAERGSVTESIMRPMGFYGPGLLVSIFGFCIWKFSPYRAVSFFVTLNGLSRIIAGLFPCDTGCPAIATSFSQGMHNAAGSLSALSLIVAAILYSWRARKIQSANWLAWYSIAAAVVSLVFVGLVARSGFTPDRIDLGLFQRLGFGLMNLWVALLALREFRLADSAAAGPRAAF